MERFRVAESLQDLEIVMDCSFKRISVVLVVLAALLMSACEINSSNGNDGGPVPLRDMHLTLTVEATDASSANVRAILNRGIGDNLYRLDGGDALEACVPSECKSLTPRFKVGLVNTVQFYEATLEYLQDVPYVVTFFRSSARTAFGTQVSLGQQFEILAPANGAQVTDGERVFVLWSPADASIDSRVHVAAQCGLSGGPIIYGEQTIEGENARDGSVEFSINEFIDAVYLAPRELPELGGTPIVPVPSNPISSCDISIKVAQVRPGQLSSDYGGGRVEGVVSRAVEIRFVPQ